MRVQRTEAGLQAASLRPFGWVVTLSLEGPWPTALFSSFPNEVGKVNTLGGRRWRRRLQGTTVRQACGCQWAEGHLPNGCGVLAKDSLSVCMKQRWCLARDAAIIYYTVSSAEI